MPEAILNQILNQLEILEPKELQQLNQAIQRYLVEQEQVTQRATFHEALLTSGLVKQLKQPAYNQQTEQQLIQVQGKPISETIIEERC